MHSRWRAALVGHWPEECRLTRQTIADRPADRWNPEGQGQYRLHWVRERLREPEPYDHMRGKEDFGRGAIPAPYKTGHMRRKRSLPRQSLPVPRAWQLAAAGPQGQCRAQQFDRRTMGREQTFPPNGRAQRTTFRNDTKPSTACPALPLKMGDNVLSEEDIECTTDFTQRNIYCQTSK